jgi:hypothetical protein
MPSQQEFEENIDCAKQAYFDATNDSERKIHADTIKSEIFLYYIWQFNKKDPVLYTTAMEMAKEETKEFVSMVAEIYNAFEDGKPA